MGNVYFGVNKTEKFYLDESKTQWIEYKLLKEGERVEYQDSISGKVSIDQETKKGEMESKIGSDRAALLKIAVCGYKIVINENGEEKELTEFTKEKWSELYDVMDGDKAEALYEAVKVLNGFTAKKK